MDLFYSSNQLVLLLLETFLRFSCGGILRGAWPTRITVLRTRTLVEVEVEFA